MRELDYFTVERLQRIIRNAEGVASPTYFEVSPADIEALARIALAAKTAEPVYWEIAGNLFTTKEDALKPGYRGTPEPLYEEPVLNSPELPDGWIPCAERMPEIGEMVLIYTRHIEMIVAALDSDGFFATSDGTCYHPDSVVLWQPAPTPPTTEK